ncbi:MAG: BolA family transcriptional regulator [Rickettsiales bacterium]|jgi:BolA protein|nr:BolA family transcriptional regulator [Rickettsiales bacterium]
MSRIERIKAIVTQALEPCHLEIIDESHKHAGHAGAAPGGETHYKLVISSKKLEGLTKVKAHQAIYQLLGDEFKSGLHALAIEIKPVP